MSSNAFLNMSWMALYEGLADISRHVMNLRFEPSFFVLNPVSAPLEAR
jgi:hypothetical protein